MSPVREPILPVLIVGAGPVGLVQAYCLSELGVPSILLARYKQRLGAPKAHALSPRSLEICRQFGISVPAIRSHPAPRSEASWVRFVTNLSGEEVGNLPYERMDVGVLDATPEMLHNISQPDFEALVAGLISNDPNVDYRVGWTWVSSADDDDVEVASVIENTETGQRETIRSSLVIGCDGANSRVRKNRGITSAAEDSAETMMTMHFSANLRPVVKERVGMLHWIMDPAARGFIIAYDLGGNQVLIHNFDPVAHPLESFTEDKCKHIVGKAIGQDIPFTFHSKLPWLLRRQVADEYFRGRVVLAGDSAHSFPPTGGLGLNSGIADAHNLAYKVAAVYHGWANLPTVLQAYQDERRPVAERNSQQSVTNGKKIFALLKALRNTDPDYEIAMRQMHEALEDPEQRRIISGLIAEQREHFDNLMLHIGYVYEDNWDPANATDFVPAFRKGARLPHAWIDLAKPHVPPVDLEYLNGDVDPKCKAAWRYSTLDLVDLSSYLLITSSTPSPQHLEIAKILSSRRIPLNCARHGTDFTFFDKAAGQIWLKEFGVDVGGSILVRPDQHVQAVIPPDAGPQGVCSDLYASLGL